jgi:hypothetical protein
MLLAPALAVGVVTSMAGPAAAVSTTAGKYTSPSLYCSVIDASIQTNAVQYRINPQGYEVRKATLWIWSVTRQQYVASFPYAKTSSKPSDGQNWVQYADVYSQVDDADLYPDHYLAVMVYVWWWWNPTTSSWVKKTAQASGSYFSTSGGVGAYQTPDCNTYGYTVDIPL